MGDAVNLAARVMAKAEPGQILATEAVLQPSRTRFETVALEPFLVKGKIAPVQALSVGAVAGSAGPDVAEVTALVGREQEIRILLDALAMTRQGRGQLVEVVGEAGIGK